VNRLLVRYGPTIVIIHGGEPGVDQAVATACRELGVPVEVRLAKWHQTALPTLGTKNRELIRAAPDLCVAVHKSTDSSKRTRDCVQQAIQAGIPTYLIDDERAVPRRVRTGDKRLA
jgi:hypothetical protein